MLRGYRSIILALGLILAGASPQPASKNQSEKEQSQGQPSGSPAPVAVSISSPVQIVQPEIHAPPCGPNEYQAKDDLCAQWKAADAASRAAIWAMIGTGVATIGTFGLYWQIVLTRRAVEDTGKATDAMREANKIAQEEFVAANPPKILVSQINIDVERWAQSGKPVSAEIYIHNDGRNDATIKGVGYDFGYGSVIFWVGRHPPIGRPFREGSGHEVDNPLKVVGGVLKAGAGHWWRLRKFDSITPQQVQRAISRRFRDKLFIIGRVHYLDTRETLHHTIFCREFDKVKRRWVLSDYPEYENQKL